ncbi:MAG: hypothetical protein LBH51_06920 [Treponema sp.]|jgi:hypothetical protein|nr:hypothetical protein [Treponema sp.]
MVPLAGALVNRRRWRCFRRYFNRLRLASTLDYAQYIGRGRAGGEPEAGPARIFRFTGGFESITDGHTLWVQGPDLTIPVALAGAQIYTLPVAEGPEMFDPSEEVLQRLRWDRVAALTGEARVFVGGGLALREGRRIFAAAPGVPLQVIFYTGSDRSMAIRAARAGHHRNEYWSGVTPYALALGALCLIAMAVAFLPRPAFRLTSITAFAAAFTPLFPLVPPGLLFTIACRWFWRRARIYRVYRDLARLPLIYFPDPPDRPADSGSPTLLPNGEVYGVRRAGELPKGIPLLAPGRKKPRKEPWYIFGSLDESGGAGEPEAGETASPEQPGPNALPREPEDSFAAFGALPGSPEKLARRCACRACLLEILAWFLLTGGIGLNVFFIAQIAITL